MCRNFTSPCASKLFVMSDEKNTYHTLRNLSGDRFHVVTLTDAVADAGEPIADYVSPLAGSQLHTVAQNNITHQLWNVHSYEVILSISLLAMADQLIMYLLVKYLPFSCLAAWRSVSWLCPQLGLSHLVTGMKNIMTRNIMKSNQLLLPHFSIFKSVLIIKEACNFWYASKVGKRLWNRLP